MSGCVMGNRIGLNHEHSLSHKIFCLRFNPISPVERNEQLIDVGV
jgi:hypothetical protein